MDLSKPFGRTRNPASCEWDIEPEAALRQLSLQLDAPAADTVVGTEARQFIDGWLGAQQFERLRLGRELHDSTGQLLLALRLGIAQLMDMGAQPRHNELLREIVATAQDIEQRVRTFAFLHYPMQLEEGGLAEALDGFVRGFARKTGLAASFRSKVPDVIDGPVALALLRVAQEGLSNVYRHAGATQVRVSLTRRSGQVRLEIADNGRGMPRDCPLTGVGLQGPRHRVERFGGSLMFARARQGTRMIATVPDTALLGDSTDDTTR